MMTMIQSDLGCCIWIYLDLFGSIWIYWDVFGWATPRVVLGACLLARQHGVNVSG